MPFPGACHVAGVASKAVRGGDSKDTPYGGGRKQRHRPDGQPTAAAAAQDTVAAVGQGSAAVQQHKLEEEASPALAPRTLFGAAAAKAAAVSDVDAFSISSDSEEEPACNNKLAAATGAHNVHALPCWHHMCWAGTSLALFI